MKWSSFLFLSFFYFTQGFADPIPQLTLQDAVFLALRYNISIKNNELDRTIQKYDLALAYHGFEPQFSLTGSTHYENNKSNGMNTVTESYSLTPKASLKTELGTDLSLTMNNGYDGAHYGQGASLEIIQPLLRGFGPEIAKRELFNAVDQEKINQLNLKKTVTSQIKEVITKYRQLLLGYNGLRISKLSLQDSISNAKKTAIEMKAGQLSGLDILQYQSNISQQQLTVSQAENQLIQDQNNLLNVIGLHSDFQFTIPHNIEVKLIKLPSYQEALQTALRNNIDYQIALIKIKTIERNLQKAQDDARWKLNLKANLGSGAANTAGTAGSIFDGANNSKSIGLELEVPIDKLKLNRNIAEAKINLQKERMELAQKQRTIELDVATNLNNLQAKEQQIRLAIASRDINAKVLAAEKKKLEYGRTDVFRVNILQRNFIDSEQTIVQNQINYLNALIDLQALLGTLLDEWKIRIRY
ncbi:MAG: TolC family protein [Gammaproteobacteria bacterium]|jgi:outer membrane protein TolC|nr:TolC family protein [Gammaproteobacteria bacterium]